MSFSTSYMMRSKFLLVSVLQIVTTLSPPQLLIVLSSSLSTIAQASPAPSDVDCEVGDSLPPPSDPFESDEEPPIFCLSCIRTPRHPDVDCEAGDSLPPPSDPFQSDEDPPIFCLSCINTPRRRTGFFKLLPAAPSVPVTMKKFLSRMNRFPSSVPSSVTMPVDSDRNSNFGLNETNTFMPVLADAANPKQMDGSDNEDSLEDQEILQRFKEAREHDKKVKKEAKEENKQEIRNILSQWYTEAEQGFKKIFSEILSPDRPYIAIFIVKKYIFTN